MNRGYFLAVFLFELHFVAAEPLKYALLGGTVYLNPEIQTSDGIQILWKHNRDKVVEFNGNEQQVYDPFEERITLDWHTAELEITGLRYEDSGDYELEVYMKKQLDHFNFKLTVIDKVSRPAISCEMKEDNQATLICSAESRQSESLMKFEWSSRGNKQPGPNLTIPLGDQNNDEEYSCTVSNPLSGETTTFTAKDCYPEKNLTGIIFGSLIAVIAILVVLGLLLFWKLRQKRKPEINRSHHEEEALIDRQSTFRSPQPLAGLTTETGGIKPVLTGSVKKITEGFQRRIDNEANSTPAKPPRTPKTSSPPTFNSSISNEDGINEQKEDIKLDQVSGELPQNTAGESSLEDKNQSHEENRSDREPDPLPGGQSTSPLQQQENGVQENEDTESVNVKKRVENIENSQRKPDKETNSTPDKPPPSPKTSSPPATDPSNMSDEDGISEQKDKNKLDQGSGELPQNTAGESGSEEKNQPHEENRSDREPDPLPGGQSTSPLQQQENGAQQNEDTESDNKTNSTPDKPSPTTETSSPSTMDSSNKLDEGGMNEQKDENKLDQGSGELPQNPLGESGSEGKNQPHGIIKHTGSLSPEHRETETAAHKQHSEPTDSHPSSIHESEAAHKLSLSSGDADTAAADPVGKDNTVSDTQSTSSNKEVREQTEVAATEQGNQNTVKPPVGETDTTSKDPENSQSADGAGDTPTQTQTATQVQNESCSAEGSKQDENQHHKEDQEENKEQSESPISSKQGKHDSLTSADSTADAADKQGDKVSSRHGSQSDMRADDTGKGDGSSKNEEFEGEGTEV